MSPWGRWYCMYGDFSTGYPHPFDVSLGCSKDWFYNIRRLVVRAAAFGAHV